MVDTEYLFKEKEAKLVDLGRTIKTDKVTFEIQILGLRDLQSVGILPVKKATVTFNFKNL